MHHFPLVNFVTPGFGQNIVMPRRRLSSKKNNLKKIERIGLVLFLVALAVGAVWRYGQDKISSPTPNVMVAPESAPVVAELPCPYRSILNGVCVESADEVSPQLVAVMVENHPESRPPSGLASAAVVYEAPLEANYTRFLAFYPLDSQVEKVGPVRSLRPYYIDWLEEYGRSLLFHVGGSPTALDKAAARGVLNLNEFYRGWYYWRSRERSAPHNVYISSSFWQRAHRDYGKTATPLTTSTWQFATTSEPCLDDVCVVSLTVSFLPPTYEATWQYVTSTGQYARYQDDAPHEDEDGTAITADTVIVQRVRTRVLDEVGRLAVTTVGSGQALVFRSGKVIVGRWQKKSTLGRTEWLDEAGAPVLLSPGKIWVEVVPPDGRVVYHRQGN